MQIDQITRLEELEALRPDWERLWQRCPAAGPFQHPDWLVAWWRHIGHGELLTLAFRQGDQLVGIAPLFVHREEMRGARQLTLLGNGVSDTLDVLLAPGADAAAAALRTIVAGRSGEWNALDFRDLSRHSPLLALAAKGDGGVVCESDTPDLVIDLNVAERHLASLTSHKLRAHLRHVLRRAEQIGEVRMSRADAADVQSQLDLLFALHGARWQRQGQPGILAGVAVQAFHREVAGRFAVRGWLRLHVLWIGGAAAAVNYGFSLRGRSYYYIGGFDPRFEPCSPGALLLQHVVSEALAEGVDEFDLLRGGEPYKYRWNAKSRPQYRLRSAAPLAVQGGSRPTR